MTFVTITPILLYKNFCIFLICTFCKQQSHYLNKIYVFELIQYYLSSGRKHATYKIEGFLSFVNIYIHKNSIGKLLVICYYFLSYP